MTVQLQLGTATFTLEGQGTRIFAGRDPSTCTLAHQDATLSRRHAEIWLQDGQAYLRDLGSANGTWANGQRLGHEPVVLQPGLLVYLGHVPLQFSVAGGAVAAAQPASPALVAAVEAHRQQAMAAAPALSASSTSTPLPADMA